MNLNDLKIFSENLNQTIEKSNYISKNDSGNFCILKNKADKNLRTLDIAKLAEQFFDQLSKDTILSIRDRKQFETDLASALKVYSNRVYRSKPWYQKIVAFFGFKSDAEKRLSIVINELFSRIHQQRKMKADIESAKTRNDNTPNFLSFLPSFNKDLKLFYHKTAENSKEIKHLNGMMFHESIDSIIDDLKHFKNRSSEKIVKKIIDGLTFARAISFLENEFYKGDLSLAILEQLQQMPISTPDDRNFMILPGGHWGHAALYIIEKHEDDKYSFRVINTGSGCSILTTPPTLDEQGVAHMPNQLAKDDSLLVISYKYSNLTGQQLSNEFFKKLLSLSKYSNDMTPVNEYIESKLRLGPNLEQDAVHEKQNHGTCSMRCLFALLSIELDVLASQAFYKHVLDREIAKFDKSKAIQRIAKVNPRILKLRENAIAQRKKLDFPIF